MLKLCFAILSWMSFFISLQCLDFWYSESNMLTYSYKVTSYVDNTGTNNIWLWENHVFLFVTLFFSASFTIILNLINWNFLIYSVGISLGLTISWSFQITSCWPNSFGPTCYFSFPPPLFASVGFTFAILILHNETTYKRFIVLSTRYNQF